MPFVEGDASLEGGKNLINFIFIYVLGNQLFYYRDKLNQINIKVYALAYVLLNIALVSMQYIFFDGKIGMLIQKSAFPYCSPFIMINAILLFMCVSKLNIRSKTINYIAASTCSVYLIHGVKPYPSIWIKSMRSYLSENISSNLELLISYFIFAIVLYMACVLLDKMLSPLWRVIGKLGNKVYIKLGF